MTRKLLGVIAGGWFIVAGPNLPVEEQTEYLVRGRFVYRASFDRQIPLDEVWVAIPALRQGVYTDSAGHFALKIRSNPGCYRLEAISTGFPETWHAFELAKNSTVDLGSFELEPTPMDQPPKRSGTCTPADTLVHSWAEAFGRAEVSVKVPDGVQPDTIWVKPDYSCSEGLGDRPVWRANRSGRYSLTLAVAPYYLTPPNDLREAGTFPCRISAWTNSHLAGYTDARIRLGSSPGQAPVTRVVVELRTAL